MTCSSKYPCVLDADSNAVPVSPVQDVTVGSANTNLLEAITELRADFEQLRDSVCGNFDIYFGDQITR